MRALKLKYLNPITPIRANNIITQTMNSCLLVLNFAILIPLVEKGKNKGIPLTVIMSNKRCETMPILNPITSKL